MSKYNYSGLYFFSILWNGWPTSAVWLAFERLEVKGKNGVGKSAVLGWIVGKLFVEEKNHYPTAEFSPEKLC